MPNAQQPIGPRALALDALLRIEKTKSYANLSLDAALKQNPLPAADRRLFTVLVYGVLERKLTLDYVIEHLSNRPLNTLDERTRMILRLGLYQLRYLDRIPPHAAVNESVALAHRASRGFVNACLREYLRRKGSIPFPDRKGASLRYLSIAFSLPEELAERFLLEFGLDRAERMLNAFFGVSALTIAVNPLKYTRETYLKILKDAEIEAIPTRYAPNGITILSPVPIDMLPEFDTGAFYVQDEASQICVEALGALPNETIIDACSCPGSKSFGSALRMQNRGEVYSFDLHENKLSLVRRSAERLGITILSACQQDGRLFVPDLEESADRVLCDVPCSGYGVLGKKPDIRYKSPKDADRLPEIQYAILDNCARYVKTGGVLVYSTCTVFSAENRKNIERFLASHRDFSLDEFSVGSLESDRGTLALAPDTHGTDGFFVARFRRNK